MNFILLLNLILAFFATPVINNSDLNSQNILYNLVDNAVANNYKYSNGITSTLLHDFSLEAKNNTASIHEFFFTEKNNCILFTRNKQQSNNNSKDVADNQYFNTILYIDRYYKSVVSLLQTQVDIKSINFNQQKKIIYFIAGNRALGYKLADNNQLTRIYQSPEYPEYPEIIDISLNHDASLLAIALKPNKLVMSIINNQDINPSSGRMYSLPVEKIVSIKFSSTDPILAIENTNNIKTSIILFKLTEDNYLGLPLYNTLGYNIIKYDITPIEKQVVLQQSTDSIDNGNKYLTIIGEKNYIDYYPNPLPITDINFNEKQMSSSNIVDFVVCKNKDTIIAIKKSASNKTALYFISAYQDKYNFQLTAKKINGKNNDYVLIDDFYPYNLEYQKSQEIFTDANSVIVNKDSSEIAVIGNNKIQIYNIKYSVIYTMRSELYKILSKYYKASKLYYLHLIGSSN
jgi:hypothetical protein